MNAFRRLATAAVMLSAGPALADDQQHDGPITHTDQLVVVTPNPPILITQGAPQGGPQGPSGHQPAQPQVAVAPAAPQNEDWNNVSHINGSIVKVGERGDYLIKNKKLNIASNPIGWMFGIYGVSVSHAVSANVAIRGDANIISIDDESGYEVGVSAPIYFRRVYSGPFIEPGIMARGMRDNNDYEYSCEGCDSGYSMVGPSV
ncbi:MAG: hypothetical protein H0T46_23105, partial [Deltaproteobacteria bacterium]|nr:hypothetical protein [Deltaproteobacteria bacterium]